jgi:7-cyano-7-deazaguanine synthase
MKTQGIVLLSGGLDSVYNLYKAHEKWGKDLSVLFYDYGQRAKESELRAAQYFANDLKLSMQVIDISKVFSLDQNSLTSNKKEVPTDTVDIESLEASKASAKNVWVANRNGVFLNIAACIAESQGAKYIIPGFNVEEAETFPDNSVEYIEKMNACFKMSTANAVEIHCFSQSMNKKQIMAESQQLKINIEKIWSCYHSGSEICKKCESCQRFLRAKAAIV